MFDPTFENIIAEINENSLVPDDSHRLMFADDVARLVDKLMPGLKACDSTIGSHRESECLGCSLDNWRKSSGTYLPHPGEGDGKHCLHDMHGRTLCCRCTKAGAPR